MVSVSHVDRKLSSEMNDKPPPLKTIISVLFRYVPPPGKIKHI